MKQSLRNILRGELVRNSAKLLSANVAAQAIGLLVYPLLTRLFSQADFGLLSLFLSIGGVLVILSTADYQFAVPLPENDKQAKGVFQTGLAVLLAVTAFECLLLPFSQPIANALHAPDLARYLWLLPLYAAALGGWQLFNYWFTRHRQFGLVSAYQVALPLLAAGLKLLSGVMHVPAGLIYSTVVASLVALLLPLFAAKPEVKPRLLPFDRQNLLLSARRYANFPLYSLPRSLLNAVNGNLAIWMIVPVFGLSVNGCWAMAMTLAFTPIGIVMNSLYQVFFPRYAMHVQQKRAVLPRFRRWALLVLCAVVPCFVVLAFLLPWLVRLLLGEGWELTADMIRLFLPWFALLVVILPWEFLPDVFGQQKYNLYLEGLKFLLRVAALAVGIRQKDIMLLTLLYSAAGCLSALIQWGWYGHLLRRYECNR